MPRNIFIFLLCFTTAIDCAFRETSSENDQTAKGVVVPGDLLIGGLFPIHQKDHTGDCSEKIQVDGILALEAFLHSLDLANKMLVDHYGFKLGAIDTCNSDRVALFNALKFVIRDYLNQKGLRKTENQGHTHDYGSDYFLSVVNIMAQNDNTSLDVIGVVGPWGSSVTLQVANLLSLFRMPQISYGASTTTLNNRKTYPYFLRTVPSDSNQARVLMEILKTWNWTYVIGAYEDTNYGTQGFHEFEKLVENTDICFADRWKLNIDQLDSSGYELRAKLRKLADGAKEARAFILYMTSNLFEMVIKAAMAEHLENRFVWIGVDAWGNQLIPKNLNPAVEGAIVSLPILKKFNSFASYFYSLKPLTNERNIWFKEFWRSIFGCSNADDAACYSKGRMKSVLKSSKFGSLHNVRDAVFAFATALKRMHEDACAGGRRGICYRMGRWLSDQDRRKLMEFLKNTTFSGVDGSDVFFLNGHDGLPQYSILNYQKVTLKNTNDTEYEWVNIGSVKAELGSGQLDRFRFDYSRTTNRYSKARFKLHLNPECPESVCGRPCDADSIRRHNQNKCCWTCERCPFPTYRVNESRCELCPVVDPDSPSPLYFKPSATLDSCEPVEPDFVHYFDNSVVAIVALASSLGLILTSSTFCIFLYYAGTPIIKASGRELSIALLSGIAVCYCTVFIVASSPNVYTCTLSRILYSTGYTICYGSIFIKTNRIARIFRTGNIYTSFRRSSYRSGGGKRSSLGAVTLKRMRYIGPLSQILFVLGLVGFQTVINIIWLILRRPTPASRLQIDYERQKFTLYKFCRAFENEDMVIALLFPVLLLLSASFYAFKTRNCPGKFNEMKYIIITTYTTCIVWLAFIPVFFATEQLNLRIYALCASLCINATVTLFCMFAPKLFVAVYRPQKNTKDAVMGKKNRTASVPPSPQPFVDNPFESLPNSFQLNCPSTRSSMISGSGFEVGDGQDGDYFNNRCPLLQKSGVGQKRTNFAVDLLTVPEPRYNSPHSNVVNGKLGLASITARPPFHNRACVCARKEDRKNKPSARRTSI